MYLIGLTGNIATGKSTVSQLLAEWGAAILDADRLAHEAMQPGTEVHAAIVRRFGSEILRADQTIDRRRLGGIVFADPAALRDLEEIVHPAVGHLWRERRRTLTAPVVVLEAIKLIEAGYHRDCDALWVVTCSPATQLRRLTVERGLTEAEAWQRINAQPPPAEKVAQADVVIENDGSWEELRARVRAEWERIVDAGGTKGKRSEVDPKGARKF